MTNPPLPMVSGTCTIEWQDTQASPAWASGVSSCPATGSSNIPLNSMAWSWHPAHHLDASTPATSCMYSIDLR